MDDKHTIQKLNEILTDSDCRITNHNRDTWMTAEEDEGGKIKYLVCYRRKHMMTTRTLYEGFDLFLALSWLETEIE